MPGPRYLDAAKGVQQQQTTMTKSRGEILSGRGGSAVALKGRTSKANHKAPTVVTLPHDPRFLFPFAVATGKKVTVQIKSGAEFEGILHGPVLGTKQLHITLKNVKLVKNPRNELNKTLIEKEYYTLIIPSLDFVQMKIQDIPNYFQSKQVDTNGTKKEIPHSGSSGSISIEGSQEERVEVVERVMDVNDGEEAIEAFEGDLNRMKASTKQKVGEYGRELKKWGDDAEDEEKANKLNFDYLEKKDTKWDQFDVNKKRFGIETTFNMEQYTSKLDVSKSRYTEEEAERLAAEIEQRPVDPRFNLDDTGKDEEDGDYPVINDNRVAQQKAISNSMAISTEIVKPEKRGTKLTWADAVKGSRQKKQIITANTSAVTSMTNTNTGQTKLTGVWAGGNSHKNRLEISHDEISGESSKQLTLTAPIRARNIIMRDAVRENGNHHLYPNNNTSTFNESSYGVIRENRMTLRQKQQGLTSSSSSTLDRMINDKQKITEEKKEEEKVEVVEEVSTVKENVIQERSDVEENDVMKYNDEDVQISVAKEVENQESVNNHSEMTQMIKSKYSAEGEINIDNKMHKNIAVDTNEPFDIVVEGPSKTTQNFNDYPPKVTSTDTATAATTKPEVATAPVAKKQANKVIRGKSYREMVKQGMEKRAADAEVMKKAQQHQQQEMAAAKTSAMSNQNKNQIPTSPLDSKSLTQEKILPIETKEEDEEDETAAVAAVQPMSSMVILPDQILPEADSSKEGDNEILEREANVTHNHHHYHDTILNDTATSNVYYNTVKISHVSPVVIPGTSSNNDKQAQQQQQQQNTTNPSIVTPNSHHVMNPNAHMFSPLSIPSGNNGYVDGGTIENVVNTMANVGIPHQSAVPPAQPSVHSDSENKMDRNAYSSFANALETPPTVPPTPGISVLNLSNRVPKQVFRNRQNMINTPETSGLQSNVDNENEMSHISSPSRPKLNHLAKPFYPSSHIFVNPNTQLSPSPNAPINEQQQQQHYHPQPMPPKDANTSGPSHPHPHPHPPPPSHPHNPNVNMFDPHQVSHMNVVPPPPPPPPPHPHPHPHQHQHPHPHQHPTQMTLVAPQHTRNMTGPHQGPMNVNQGQPPPPQIPPNSGLPHNTNNTQVVTPWPNIPGTGVWHSNMVSNHRNIQSGPPMPINNYMPPAMPGPYPMFMPTPPPPPPFMPNGLQDPSMWAAGPGGPMPPPPPPPPPPHPMPGIMEPHPHPQAQMIYNGFYGGKQQGVNMKSKMTPLPHGKPPGNFGNNSMNGSSGNANNNRNNRNNRRQTTVHGQENQNIAHPPQPPQQQHQHQQPQQNGGNEQTSQNGMEIVN